MPEQTLIVPGQSDTGASIFSVLVKRTYDLHPGAIACRAEPDASIRQVDEFYDHADPERFTVRLENDVAPYKLETDVVVVAKAHAPGAQPVQALTIGVEVAGRRKAIRVIGDRACRYQREGLPVFSDPIPFREMEIRYERAYGGRDSTSDPELDFFYPRNPLGTGLALANSEETIAGLRLPNLEDPSDLLTPERLILGAPEHWNRQPLPQGLGWLQRNWYPRCSFVGAVPGFVDIDEEMREEQLGLVPRRQIALSRQFQLPSFDVRFNNGASVGLRFPYLSGDELIRVANLTPGGGLVSYRLPGERPQMMLDIGLGENALDVVLHTVCMRVEDGQVDLIWRGAHEYPGADWLPEMKRLHAEVA